MFQLAEVWGQTPKHIEQTYTAHEIGEALAYYRIKHKEQAREANRQTAVDRAQNAKRLY